MMSYRTDRNNNPTAFTTDIAKEAGLVLGVDYEAGDPFPPPSKLTTAKLLGDPLKLTIQVINKIGFYEGGTGTTARWTYIAIPFFVWNNLMTEEKIQVIKAMYQCEGGTALLPLFD